MPHDPGQGDPNVPVEEFGVGRSGRGIVVDARALDLRAVTLGGRVVQGQEDVVPAGQTLRNSSSNSRVASGLALRPTAAMK